MPARVTKKQALESISTRAEYNRLIKSLQRFSKRGAEQPVSSSRGAKSTKWETEEYKIKQRIENARRTRERKKLEAEEVLSRGKGTGQKRASMGTIKENALKPIKKDFQNLSSKEWDLAKRNIDRQLNAKYREVQKKKMKDNYIKGLTEAGYPESLIKQIKETPLDAFVHTVNTDQEASFDFIYDPLEMKTKADALAGVWSNAVHS